MRVPSEVQRFRPDSYMKMVGPLIFDYTAQIAVVTMLPRKHGETMLGAKTERNRMMIDLPPEVQMAIKIRAAKSNTTTGAVVCQAIEKVFGKYIAEAKDALAEFHAKKGG